MIASLQVGSISERFLCLCNVYIIFCLSGRYQYGNIVSVSVQIKYSKKFRKAPNNLYLLQLCDLCARYLRMRNTMHNGKKGNYKKIDIQLT